MAPQMSAGMIPGTITEVMKQISGATTGKNGICQHSNAIIVNGTA
jgi:hypothetical protein